MVLGTHLNIVSPLSHTESLKSFPFRVQDKKPFINILGGIFISQLYPIFNMVRIPNAMLEGRMILC